MILQKFIKSKGRKPSITRVFWKQPVGGSKSIVGWNLCNNADFMPPPPSAYTLDKKEEEKLSQSKGLKSDLIRPMTNGEYDVVKDLKNHLYRGASERAQIKVKEANNFSNYGHFNVCSLTNLDGVVTDIEMNKVTPFKMSPKTIEVPEIYTERIISYIQKFAETREGLYVNVTEIVCDFLKDDNDKWWFIQVKGLRLCRRSRQQIHRWKVKKFGHRNDLEDEEDDEETFQQQYKRKIKEAREKAKENMDNQCKMCGIFYTEGELLSKSSLNTLDSVDEEEKRLETTLLNQKKAEDRNMRIQKDLLKQERGETVNRAYSPTSPELNDVDLKANLKSSPGYNEPCPESPIKSPSKYKPHNPSFNDLKKQANIKSIADEEGVDIDMVRR